ncbi:MAG: hypothetical protein MJB57_11710 [Gemmatimonadetes bacterium]|nr:hypothetical protein [Gemmatimonadota bacterium]
MNQRLLQRTRSLLAMGIAASVGTVGCGDSALSGVAFGVSGADVAGVYNSFVPDNSLELKLVVGSGGGLSGQYQGPSGLVRFDGRWERRSGGMTVFLSEAPGVPAEIELDISREVTTTIIPDGPFSTRPETAPTDLLEQEVMRLRGTAIFAGVQIEVDLVRIIFDVVVGGGPPRS